jgi:hypothetical protein
MKRNIKRGSMLQYGVVSRPVAAAGLPAAGRMILMNPRF